MAFKRIRKFFQRKKAPFPPRKRSRSNQHGPNFAGAAAFLITGALAYGNIFNQGAGKSGGGGGGGGGGGANPIINSNESSLTYPAALTISGSGFTPGGTINAFVYSNGAPYHEYDFVADSTGSFSGTPIAYANTTDTLTINASDYTSGILSPTITVNIKAMAAPDSVSITLYTPVINGPTASGDISMTQNGVASSTQGTITSFTFNAGDGIGLIEGAPSLPISYAYSKNGNFTITVTAYDSLGNSAQATQSITITGAGPMLNPMASFTPTTFNTTQAGSLAITGSGFTPNGSVELRFFSDKSPFGLLFSATVTAGSAGNVGIVPVWNIAFSAGQLASFFSTSGSTMGATLTDVTTGLGTLAQTITLTVPAVVNPQLSVSGSIGLNQSPTFNVTGMTPGGSWSLRAAGNTFTGNQTAGSSGTGSLQYNINSNSTLYLIIQESGSGVSIVAYDASSGKTSNSV
jgi:hypothetical protein